MFDGQLVRRPVKGRRFPVLVRIKIPGCENVDPGLEALFLLPYRLCELVPEIALAAAVRRRLECPERVDGSWNRRQEVELEPPGIIPKRDLGHMPDIELLAGADTRLLVGLLVGDGGLQLCKRQMRVLDIVLDLGLQEPRQVVVPDFVTLVDLADFSVVK